jgi:hypothetical protein
MVRLRQLAPILDNIQFWDNPFTGSSFAPSIRRFWRRMQKSLRSPEYARLIATLVAARKGAGVRQQALAAKLGRRPQSFIANRAGTRGADIGNTAKGETEDSCEEGSKIGQSQWH